MRITIFVSIVAFLFIGNIAYSQNNTSFIKNVSIGYQVLYLSPKLLDSNRAIPSKHIIRVNLKQSERKLVNSIKKNQWISLLQSNKTDWAANLILYDRYQKDAILYTSVIKTREDWVAVIKDKDIAYWKEFIK